MSRSRRRTWMAGRWMSEGREAAAGGQGGGEADDLGSGGRGGQQGSVVEAWRGIEGKLTCLMAILDPSGVVHKCIHVRARMRLCYLAAIALESPPPQVCRWLADEQQAVLFLVVQYAGSWHFMTVLLCHFIMLASQVGISHVAFVTLLWLILSILPAHHMYHGSNPKIMVDPSVLEKDEEKVLWSAYLEVADKIHPGCLLLGLCCALGSKRSLCICFLLAPYPGVDIKTFADASLLLIQPLEDFFNSVFAMAEDATTS
ncbi:uncharacterized protein [Miscanthus floridulus]|uniref:uncharacterized protein isoform X2 n=1 Tax=Miscanthus floridulus TaxID=154761 RepID=UPI00345878FB